MGRGLINAASLAAMSYKRMIGALTTFGISGSGVRLRPVLREAARLFLLAMAWLAGVVLR